MHKRMTTRTFTVSVAKKGLSKLIRHAESRDDVYITLAGKLVVKVVPIAAPKSGFPEGLRQRFPGSRMRLIH